MSIKIGATAICAALVLAGCAKRALELPTDPIERAATCAVVAAASERIAAGVKGELSPEAQGRLFHYPLLAASEGESYDSDKAAAVFQRERVLIDPITKGKWQDLKPACAEAYPAAAVKAPALPEAPLDSVLQCYMTADFMRKALADQGGVYVTAAARYGALTNRLDGKVATALTKAGIKGNDAIQLRRKRALAAAAKLGPPPEMIAACEKKYS